MDFTKGDGMRDYNYILNEIRKNLTESRFNHSLNVEKEAVRLGKIYGADLESCSIAGIAHDCVKCMPNDELLKMAENYNVHVDDIQKASPQLLHGPVGAAYCKDKFDIDDEDILNAITYHTTGRADMSLLEKIIYIGDLIEESRKFEGVDDIRREVVSNLDKAILMSCNCTIKFVMQKNQLIHPLTIELRNNIIMRGDVFAKA